MSAASTWDEVTSARLRRASTRARSEEQHYRLEVDRAGVTLLDAQVAGRPVPATAFDEHTAMIVHWAHLHDAAGRADAASRDYDGAHLAVAP